MWIRATTLAGVIYTIWGQNLMRYGRAETIKRNHIDDSAPTEYVCKRRNVHAANMNGFESWFEFCRKRWYRFTDFDVWKTSAPVNQVQVRLFFVAKNGQSWMSKPFALPVQQFVPGMFTIDNVARLPNALPFLAGGKRAKQQGWSLNLRCPCCASKVYLRSLIDTMKQKYDISTYLVVFFLTLGR